MARISTAIKDQNLNFPSTLQLKSDGTVDVSGFIREIKKTANTNYDNEIGFRNILWTLKPYIEDLCTKSHLGKKRNGDSACVAKTLSNGEGLSSAIKNINSGKMDKILFPENYVVVGELSDTVFESAFQALDSTCIQQKCYDKNLLEAIRFSSQKQYQKLLPKIKEQDSGCAKELLDNIGDRLEGARYPKACLEKENKAHIVCKTMLKDLRTLKKRLSDLLVLTGVNLPSSMTEAGFCPDCLEEERGWTQMLQSLSTKIQEIEMCQELGPGEEKRVTVTNDLNADYILKRDQKGHYHIDFPIEFYLDKDYDGEKTTEFYRQKVQECLKSADPLLLGPNGEKIKLSISQVQECPKKRQTHPVRIGIGSKDIRSSAIKYESDIDCPTILHEILHLTGLCDEYKEEVIGAHLVDSETGDIVDFVKPNKEYEIRNEFDCRVVAENSIMSNHNVRWGYAKENNKSLLSPGHFNSLLYGSCLSKNQQFYECSLLAYKSSFSSWWTVKEEDCQSKRRNCEKNNALGHNKQEQLDALKEKESSLLEEIDSFKEKIRALEQRNSGLREWLAILRRYIFLNTKEKALLWAKVELKLYEDRLLSVQERLEIIRSWPDPED